MSGFYSKAVVEIRVGTIGANVNDFVARVQVEKRLNELEIQKTNARNAIEFIQNEERALNYLLEDLKH